MGLITRDAHARRCWVLLAVGVRQPRSTACGWGGAALERTDRRRRAAGRRRRRRRRCASRRPYAQAASGADEAALRRIARCRATPRSGQAARYNSANLLLRQAIVLRAAIAARHRRSRWSSWPRSIYRDVLRRDPQALGRALQPRARAAPLPDPDEAEAEPADPQRNAERAATTMRGYSPGLP